jgi:hypothetical protein
MPAFGSSPDPDVDLHLPYRELVACSDCAPLGVPDFPVHPPTQRRRDDHSCDIAAVRYALEVLTFHGVRVLGPLSFCDECGWFRLYQDWCLGDAPRGLTAVWWNEEEAEFAFEREDRADPRSLGGPWNRDLVGDLPFYWCGDERLISFCLTKAGIPFATPTTNADCFWIKSTRRTLPAHLSNNNF